MLHAARCKCRTQKVAKNRHLGTAPQLCRAISLQLRHVSTIGKNLLSSNISSTCPHNMVNVGPLAAEIVSYWGTPGNFNGFRVLAALLPGTLVVGVSQTAAFNRGRHLYSVKPVVQQQVVKPEQPVVSRLYNRLSNRQPKYITNTPFTRYKRLSN